MDHKEESGITLGLVQVPEDKEPTTEIELSERIDMVVHKYSARLSPDHRREFEEDMDEIKSQASLLDFDTVTGLLNRRAAALRYRRILGRSRSGSLGIIFADIDEFKIINSLFTRAGGDIALRAIGKILQDKAREEEIMIGRLGDGADEFLAVVHRMPDSHTFKRMVLRIESALNSVELQKEAGYAFDHPLRISVACAKIHLYGHDRREYAEIIGKRIYQQLSLAVDKAKAERKDPNSIVLGGLGIPFIHLAVHKAEVSQTAELRIPADAQD